MKNKKKSRFLSEFTDPFSIESISAVHIHVLKGFSSETMSFSASVEFRKGQTEGKQNIKALDFPTLIKKVESFVKEL